MRAREFTLLEGGHALNKLGVNAIDVTPINYKQVRNYLEPILKKLGLKPIWTMGGSGSWNPEHPYYTTNTIKTISSDVDVMIDTTDLMVTFPPDEPKKPATDLAKALTAKLGSSRAKLEDYFKKLNLPVLRSGVSVHVGIPVNDDYVQVDIMAVENAAHAIGGHEHDYSTDQGMSGGVLHGGMWADLARASVNPLTGESKIIDAKGQANSALQLSPYKGLVDRATGKLLYPWSQKDNIAKIIIGSDATKDDMSSYSRLYKALQKYPAKLAAVRQHFPQDMK